MEKLAEKIADRLQSEGEKTHNFFLIVPPEVLGKSIYTDGASWSVHQVIAHLVDAEDSLPRLFRYIVDGGEGVPQDFDLNRYNERAVEKLEALTIDELAALFMERRKRTIEFISSLRDEDFSKEGFHPFLGQAAVKEMIRLFYIHAQIHLRDIRNLF